MIPLEPLLDVFRPDVIAKLEQTGSPSDRLQTRLTILHSGGLNLISRNRELRAF
jgi:hypothetical protein